MREENTRQLPEAEKRTWLRLIRSENVGPVTFHALLERFGTGAAALAALPRLARRGGRRAVQVCPADAADREWAQVHDAGARVVALGEADYPPLLAQVEDAPPLLFVLGHPTLLTKRSVGLVGARNASLNGCRFAGRLAADLGTRGLLVVSGLARGIDAAAHAGALETGTVAVLGGGVDVVYPNENRALYEQIRDRGALVSEVAMGTRPQARHFPRRNRIIAGMSRGVVVVEAGLKSGSLITARLALEQGREVFAVPGSPLDPRAKGANELIRQGAQLTESADDVIQALRDSLRSPLEERKAHDFQRVPVHEPDEAEVDAAHRVLADMLGPHAVTVDEILRNCQFSPAVVATALLELELAGRLDRHPGNQVSLVLSA
ncbi:MAG: DNA-processing protein DprA [Rhodobacterales bacterium]|nr:DNA-processing protein DprA [Rhodobacterales bacterium]